jgi:hypothetical protein
LALVQSRNIKKKIISCICSAQQKNTTAKAKYCKKIAESLNDAKANFGILLFDCGGNGYQIDAPRYSIITSSAEGIALLEKDYSFGRNFSEIYPCQKVIKIKIYSINKRSIQYFIRAAPK